MSCKEHQSKHPLLSPPHPKLLRISPVQTAGWWRRRFGGGELSSRAQSWEDIICIHRVWAKHTHHPLLKSAIVINILNKHYRKVQPEPHPSIKGLWDVLLTEVPIMWTFGDSGFPNSTLSKTCKSHSMNAFNKYDRVFPLAYFLSATSPLICFKFLNIYQCSILMLKADYKTAMKQSELISDELMPCRGRVSHHVHYLWNYKLRYSLNSQLLTIFGSPGQLFNELLETGNFLNAAETDNLPCSL